MRPGTPGIVWRNLRVVPTPLPSSVMTAWDDVSSSEKYVSGTLDETRHYYLSSSSQVLEERVDSETDAAQQFVWGIRFVDDLVLRDKDLNSDGVADERLYALADPRFSILAVTDDSGSVQERYSYAALRSNNGLNSRLRQPQQFQF